MNWPSHVRSLLISADSSRLVHMAVVVVQERERAESMRGFQALAQNWHIISLTASFWPKHVTERAQIQREGKQTHLLIGRVAESVLQRVWIQWERRSVTFFFLQSTSATSSEGTEELRKEHGCLDSAMNLVQICLLPP